MTTERDVLELLAEIRAQFQANPNDTGGRDAVRRLVEEIDGAPEPRPIALSTWVGQPEPEPRRWLVNAWLPAGRVALLTGSGRCRQIPPGPAARRGHRQRRRGGRVDRRAARRPQLRRRRGNRGQPRGLRQLGG